MKKGLNAFQLKCICIGMMIAGVYLHRLIYLAAFPLAAFLLVVAYKQTLNRKHLLKRLLLSALLVEIPMDIATFGVSEWKNWGLNQNYFFTLSIALGVIMAVDSLGKKYAAGTMSNTLTTLGVYLLGALAAILGRTEQSSIGVLLAVTLYLFYGNKILSLVSVLSLYILFMNRTTGLEYVPALSVLFTWLYNGEQGKNGKAVRVVCYFAFPVAYCVLGILEKVL